MKTEYYLFDFDGVLVDSMEFWLSIHIQTLHNAGIPVPEDFVETITPLGNYHGAKYTLSLGVDLDLDEYLNDVYKKLYEAYTTHICLKANVKEALTQLKQEGLSLNVLTASSHLYVESCLKRNGIYELFDNVWTIEDFGLTKGEIEIYQQAASRLGTKIGCCTMFDDNFTVITTAKKAGMKTVAVYDASAKVFVNAMTETADRYIYDFKELITEIA